MKLITLNLWGGRVKEKYPAFFDKHAEADILFFQEVFKTHGEQYHVPTVGYSVDLELLGTLSGHLGSHEAHFCQVLKDYYGIASFFREGMRIVEKGEMLVARGDWDDNQTSNDRDHHRKAQWFEVEIKGKRVLFVNVHLTHRPEGKRDSPKRIMQSDMLIRLITMFDGPKILAGDFNLLPDTESIRMIEAAGMRNLVKEYGIEATRTELYKKPLKFADYVFVSPGVKVNDFKVLPDVVSDHAPLALDFDIE